MMKAGDKFIYHSKYGGIVRGEIAEIFHINAIDVTNKLFRRRYKVRSTNGIVYELNEIDIVDEMSDKAVSAWTNALDVIGTMQDAKRQFRESIEK